MIVVVPAAKNFISSELVNIWGENFPGAMAWYGIHSYVIYYNSDLEWAVLGNAPRMQDLLCVIDFDKKGATYYINGNKFESEKDYISALKNIAFL